MWNFVSSILRGKEDEENESSDSSEEYDSSEEPFVDCVEGEAEVSSLRLEEAFLDCLEGESAVPSPRIQETFLDCLEGDSELPSVRSYYTPGKFATSSVYPPLSTIAAQPLPSSHGSSFSRRGEVSSLNSAQHWESVSHPNELSADEFYSRPGNEWNHSADSFSTDISGPQELWEESSGSTPTVYKWGFPVHTAADYGSGASGSSANGEYSQIHRIPNGIPRQEFTSADRRLSASGPQSCAVPYSPRRVDNGQSRSVPVVLDERGSPAYPYRNGAAVRSSWSNVKCGVRARESEAPYPLGEDWREFNEPLDVSSQDDDRLAAAVASQSFAGTSGTSFLEEWSANQSRCSSPADILQSRNLLGAFPLTNSPNCTVDQISRQHSQLRFPQRQGVDESSEKPAFDPVSSFSKISLDPQWEENGQRQSHGGRSVQWPQLTEHLSILENLDFSLIVFPVLTRLEEGKSLKQYFELEELQELGSIPKEEVGRYLWLLDGFHCRSNNGPPPTRDASASSVFRCTVHRTGNYTFQIEEEKNQASTLLQRVLGFDRVLKVYFEDGPGNGKPTKAQYAACQRLGQNGIFAGLRRYQYFVHKPSDKFEQKAEGKVKCYFVCTESRANADLQDPQFVQFRSIADLRSLFMHIHTTESLSKYIARLQLVLSKTVSVTWDWSEVKIEEVDDVYCEDSSGQGSEEICTDGTGYISVDLAKKMDKNVYRGMPLKLKSSNEVEEECPSIFQVRIFQDGVALKGTLATNRELPPNTIRCYKSMVKVRRDIRATSNSLTSMDLVSSSQKTNGKAKLSQDLILLLSLCKVPEAFFMKHLTTAMEKSYLIFSDPRAALEEILDWENHKAEILADMVSAKISLQEPFLHKSLLDMSKSRLQDFSKGKFALEGTHYLYGSADPTGTLKRNQVTITLSEGPVYCSKVLVYRAPGKYPGDIHVFQATCNEQVEAAISPFKYAIYFSTLGPRPITDEIGKGDLDGDRYWVCKNAELISYFQEWHCRWERGPTTKSAESMRKPAEYSPEELETELFELCLTARFNMKSVVGQIAHGWLKHMDEHLHIKDEDSEEKWGHLEEALKLPTPYYDALDCAKTGIKVSFFDKTHDKMYIFSRAKDSYEDVFASLKSVQMYLNQPCRPREEWEAKTPHHMEKKIEGYGVNAFEYHSKSILGKIYDQAASTQDRWCLPSYDNFELDAGFQVANCEKHFKQWQKHFGSYLKEMSATMVEAKKPGGVKSTDPEMINIKYRKILYGGYSSFKVALVFGKKERRQLILEEASAIYTVVYDTGKYYISKGWEPKLSFAWNVAGEALCEIYSQKQPGRSLHMSFSYFKEIFQRKKSRHQAPLSP